MKNIQITTTDDNGLWQTQNSRVSDRLADDICIAAFTGKTHMVNVKYTSRAFMQLINDRPEYKLQNLHLLKTIKNRRH